MKLLFASDSFKGSLTNPQTTALLTKAANEVFDHPQCSGVAVADGGEGTVDAVISATGGEAMTVPVHGPLGDAVNATYGQLGEGRAIMEMAAASGLPLVPADRLDVMHASTYGTGEMILDALQKGYTDLSIAIGGSATNDGGIGCLKALGIKFLDKDGKELSGCGEDLIAIDSIDVTGLTPLAAKATFTVMCDVTNPLCGPDGATYTFGRQKGATEELQRKLEAGMCNYRDVIIRQFGVNPDEMPGSGAAGGLGCALAVFLKAQLKSGIETVLDLIDFDHLIEDVDLVITGEGRTDWQSAFGKVLQGIGERCEKKDIPVIAISGCLGKNAEAVYEHGVTSLMTTVNAPMDITEAMARAEELYYSAAVRTFRMVKAGMQVQKALV